MLDLGWQDGNRKRKFVYAKTRAEAARKLADAQRDLREGRLVTDERTTTETYLRAWLEMIEPTVGPRTHSATSSSSGSTGSCTMRSRMRTALKGAHEFVTFTPEQARRFLQAVKGDRLEALYVVALTTRMREGGLLGLRWADVDLDEAALHVTRRLKRRTSRRQVLLVGPTVQALKLHRERQDK